METFPFLEFIVITFFFLDYSLYAPMDQCHQRIPFQKTKKCIQSYFKNVTVLITGIS